MGNSLFPEKDYIGLGDGPIDSGDLDQGFGAAFGAATGQGMMSSPVIGTGTMIATLPPLAKDKWVPPIGQDTIKPLFTVSDPDVVAARGDKLFQSEEELKGYVGYNSKIPYEPGMTQSRYDTLVEMRTDQLRREAATAGRPFTNVFGQIIGGAPDPSNWIPIFGRLGDAWKLSKGARLGWETVKSGSEAGVGSTLAMGALSSREKALGNDVSIKAYIETASLGFMIGAVFGTLGRGVSHALTGKSPGQTVASQTIISSPITPQSAPDAIAVLADAYDSFMVNNGLATPYYAGGKGGPIQFGSHSQEAFTKGIHTAQRSVDLNWTSVVLRRKNEQEPLPMGDYNFFGLRDDTREAKYIYLESIREKDPAGYKQLSKELDDYYTYEADMTVVNRIIDDPGVKQKAVDSKARDATGRLSTVFIGTQYGTDTRIGFDKDKVGKNSGAISSRLALWATDNPNNASEFAMNNYLNHEESQLAGDPLFQNPPTQRPNVRPAVLNMVNPMIVDYEGKGYQEAKHVKFLKEAREKGHDGVIFKNVVDTPGIITKDPALKAMANKALTPSTHYAIFDPKQIIDLQDVSADFGKVIDQQQAYIDARAAKAASTIETSNIKSPAVTGYDFGIKKGYDYDSQVAASTTLNDVASNKFIDVLPLIRAAEKNDEVKYQDLSNKAADLDIEAKTTGFEDEMELALARVPLRPEEEAFALKVDEDIAVADQLEVFIHAAIKCMGD